MDLAMPVMNGIDTIKAIRKMKIKTPIILLTGYNKESKQIKKAIKYGVNDVFIKPFTMNTMNEVINHYTMPKAHAKV